MTATPTNLLRHIQELVAGRPIDPLTDRQLLERFASGREEAAFALLVRRHGPMVLGLCRRVLGHEQDAEDAFQAAFLVLARKAASVRRTDVGGFLYRVAYHLAVRARGLAARRGRGDANAAAARSAGTVSSDPVHEVSWREVRAVVEEELQRLPDRLRSAVVLCYLEGRTRPEAARLLGWSQGTLHARLERGRELLRRRLLARGLAPAAALTASLFAEDLTSAVPAALAGATVRSVLTAAVAPAVAALADAGGAMLSAGKARTAALVLLLGLLSAAAVWAGPVPAVPPAGVAGSPPDRAEGKPAPAAPRHEDTKTVEIRGRVLGPDGRPKAGAKILSLGKDEKLVELGVSAEDGGFTVAAPKEGKHSYLIARCEGTGFDFLDLDSVKPGKPAELRLVKDNAIRGRVVNTEGKPLRGVRVTAWEVETYLNGSLDSFTAAWMNLHVMRGRGLGTAKQLLSGAGALFATTTDGEGRFTLRGVGGERTVRLHFRGGGIADTEAWVVNRAGFDPGPYNAANMERNRDGRRAVNWRWWVLSGPDVSLVAPAEKVIRGVVTDADTGEPRPGAEVLLTEYKDEPIQDSPRAKTDAAGRYEIRGARKAKSYLVAVLNDATAGYVASQLWADDTAGYQPVRADLKVKKGVIVTGKVIDGTTGEALPAFVMAAVLRGNPFVKDYPPFEPLFMAQCHSFARAEAGGSFRLVTLPGPVLLMGKPEGRSSVPYRWAGADPKYPQYFSKDGGSFYGHNFMAPLQGSCKVLDIKPGAAEVKQDFVLQRQKVLTGVRIEDAEGRPVTGAWAVAGGDKFWVPYRLLEGNACPVYGEASDKPQRMIVYQPEMKLAGTLALKGDEKQPLLVKLGPAGSVAGRVLDAEGRPLAGVVVDLRYRDGAAEEIHKRAHEGKEIVTDAGGAFAFDEVMPGWEFELTFRRGTRTFERETKAAGAIEIKPGERRDLGAIKVKRAPERMEK